MKFTQNEKSKLLASALLGGPIGVLLMHEFLKNNKSGKDLSTFRGREKNPTTL